MIQLSHIAVWSNDIERLRDFYIKYFDGISGKKYENPAKGFSSFFVRFPEGTALEIMNRRDITPPPDTAPHYGWAHIAFTVGTPEEVDRLTERLRSAGHPVTGEPRTTGDGFYEAVIADPDGNTVELVAVKAPQP